MLEMDRLERQLVNLPLLQDPSSYIPDTVDLTEDALAREYWLYCFEDALDGVDFPISRNPSTLFCDQWWRCELQRSLPRLQCDGTRRCFACGARSAK